MGRSCFLQRQGQPGGSQTLPGTDLHPHEHFPGASSSALSHAVTASSRCPPLLGSRELARLCGAAALIPSPKLPVLPMPELKPLAPGAQDIPTEPSPSSKSSSLHPLLQKGAHDRAPGSPFPFFPYKSSSNMLQDPTCQRPFPAACSPDIKPQQQGNEDPCREKETMRG